ncbi:MAG TPA: hypothetical protein VD837_13845 [Terriglobales bacterium]|nr:hypothetical protein [Terriglobales bacterium]
MKFKSRSVQQADSEETPKELANPELDEVLPVGRDTGALPEAPSPEKPVVSINGRDVDESELEKAA